MMGYADATWPGTPDWRRIVHRDDYAGSRPA